MADTPFATLWTDAKTAFHTKSARKKPSEKFLSFFRKSSGLEKATADLDKAIDKASLDNLKALSVALNKFIAVKDTYMTTLTAAQNREEEPTYKKACIELSKKLAAMEPDFIERRREKLVESLDNRLNALSATIGFDGVGMGSAVREQGASISDQKDRIKGGRLLAPAALKSIQKEQEALGKKLVKCETKILPEIAEYCAYLGVKNLQALGTSKKPAMALDLMEFTLKKHNQNAAALESLIKDSERATNKYNAEALVPLRKAVAKFNDMRKKASKIAVQWTVTRGKTLVQDNELKEINAHLATTFEELDRATDSLCSEIKKADLVLEKNKAQLGEMAKVVKSVHKYDGSLQRLQKKMNDALNTKLTKKSTEDDVCKLGSPLSTVLDAMVGLEA